MIRHFIRTALCLLMVIFGIAACNNPNGSAVDGNPSLSENPVSTSDSIDTGFGNRQNPLFGVIYRDADEIPQLKSYKDIGGSIIDDTAKVSEFGISHLTDSMVHVLTFEKFVHEPNNPQPKYKILDTINIASIKENEYITYCNCRQDTVPDAQIIALVIAEDKEYLDNVVKAWRANMKTGKITPIKNTKGINCVNEDYGTD